MAQYVVGNKAICDVPDDDKPTVPPSSVGDDTGAEGTKGTVVPRRDPLVLDLDGDGIETTGSRDPVVTFDHDGDGVKTGTGWVKPDDGWLVRDLNGNGTIDKGAELMGVDTVKRNGSKASDGFDALADLDSNQDGVVDANDATFTSLKVWKDANGNGITDEGELLTLAQAGIKSFKVSYTSSDSTDSTDDVWFNVDTARTKDTDMLGVTPS